MQKVGYVVDEKNGKVILDVRRTGSCGDKCVTCSSHCEVPSLRVELDNKLSAKRGDFIEVGMQPKNLIHMTFLMYIIPLIAFVGSMVGGYLYFKSLGWSAYEPLSLLSGILGLAVAYGLLRVITEKRQTAKEVLEMKKIL